MKYFFKKNDKDVENSKDVKASEESLHREIIESR